MSQDPWRALDARRQRRAWRQWPWGLIALGLALLSLSGVFFIFMLMGAAMRPPGDGAGINLKPYVLVLALAELGTISAGVIAAILAWRFNRGKGLAAVAIVLLSLWVGTLLHDLL